MLEVRLASKECEYSYLNSTTQSCFTNQYHAPAMLVQIQRLLCEAASELNYDMSVKIYKKDQDIVQEYKLLDHDDCIKLYVRYINHAILSKQMRIIKHPKTLKQVNLLVEKISQLGRPQKETNIFQKFLSKIATQHECRFNVDTYYDYEDELGMAMESKTGFQQLEVSLEQ